jgi:hypothetical protein
VKVLVSPLVIAEMPAAHNLDQILNNLVAWIKCLMKMNPLQATMMTQMIFLYGSQMEATMTSGSFLEIVCHHAKITK